MNIQIEVVGPCRKQISIEVPADRVTKAFEDVADGYSRYAKIPGFRPGKAPRNLIQSRFKKEILKDVKEQLIPSGYHEALQSEKIETIGVIDVTDGDPVSGQPFAFQVTVDVFPEFDLPDYKAVRIDEKSVEVTEDAINEVVEQMRDRMATHETVEGRQAEKGDKVMVSYTATLDGQPMADLVKEHAVLAQAENFGVILDPDYSFLPEFADKLVGIAAGETRDVEVSFDENFVEAALAGKKAVYTIQAHQVQVKKLPELDAEFLKSLGVENEADMRARISTDLTRMKVEQEQRRVQDEICKKLLESTAMSVPESELQRRTADEVYDMVEYNTNRGIDRSAIEENREKIFEAAAKTAEEKLKIRYILLRIAREEKLSVSDAEVESRIQMLAMQARKDPAKLKSDLVKNNRIGALREDLAASKALNLMESMQKPQITAA